jgi:hypothetical protein
MFLSTEIAVRLDWVINEQKHIEQIAAHGLTPRRKFRTPDAA